MTDAKPVEVGALVARLDGHSGNLAFHLGFHERLHRDSRDALLALQAEVARLTQENERLAGEWKRECDDADGLLSAIGLDPAQYRTKGGSLMVTKAANAIKEARRDEQ